MSALLSIVSHRNMSSDGFGKERHSLIDRISKAFLRCTLSCASSNSLSRTHCHKSHTLFDPQMCSSIASRMFFFLCIFRPCLAKYDAEGGIFDKNKCSLSTKRSVRKNRSLQTQTKPKSKKIGSMKCNFSRGVLKSPKQYA